MSSKILRAAMASTAIIGLLALSEHAALAQSTAETNAAMQQDAVEQVVVTGTHIHGVAPVGSEVVTLGAEDLEKQGATTLQDLVQNLPAVSDLGSNAGSPNSGRNIQGGSGNGLFASSINLRGIGAQDTLNLVNGMRLVPSQTGDTWDINVIPTLLVQRLDIVADGGSATYGADAVTGTVNVIYREPTDTFETQLQAGHASGTTDYQANVLLGHTWSLGGVGDGGLMLAVTYQHSDPLYAVDRPALYNSDLSPYLGAAATPLSTFTNPGNVVIGTTSYAVPTGIGGTQGVTLAQLGAANQPNHQNAYNSLSEEDPSNNRWSAGFNFKQAIGDQVSFFANGILEWRRANATYQETGNQNQTLSVPATNPYSPCNAAAGKVNAQGIVCPASGTVSVQENLEGEIGGLHRGGVDKLFMISGGVNLSLPFDWRGTIATSLGQDYSDARQAPAINSTALTQVLSGTNKPSTVPFFNPFCSDNVVGPACNSAVTNAYISGFTDNIFTNMLAQTSVNFDGPIFTLPGGQVRLAVGGEYDNEMLFSNNDASNTAAIGVVIHTPAESRRNVAAYYGELYVPIVGQANALPFVEKLEVTVAGRYTDYSDFGVTANPKVGINWVPVDDLKLHTSYGTSFRAPSLRDASTGIAAALNVNNNLQAANYTGIRPPTPATTPLSDLENSGGDPAIRPETAVTWSMGANYTPSWLEGLDVGLNYYNIHIRQQIAQVARDAGDPGVVNGGIYDNYLVLNPTYFPARAVVSPAALQFSTGLTPGAALTQAQYNAIIANVLADPRYAGAVPPTSPVIFFCNCVRNNGGQLKTDGLDITADYNWDMGWATANVGVTAAYQMDFDLGITPTSPITDLNNSLGYPLRFKGRFHAGLDWEGLSSVIYVNYKNPYHVDPTLLPGNTPPQYRNVDSWTTIDATLSYELGNLGKSYLNDTRVTIGGTNLFSERPPLVLSTTGVLFDGSQANDVGRHVFISLDKKF